MGQCGGTRQSPININPFGFKHVTTKCPSVDFISYHSKPEMMYMMNLGFTGNIIIFKKLLLEKNGIPQLTFPNTKITICICKIEFLFYPVSDVKL